MIRPVRSVAYGGYEDHKYLKGMPKHSLLCLMR